MFIFFAYILHHLPDCISQCRTWCTTIVPAFDSKWHFHHRQHPLSSWVRRLLGPEHAERPRFLSPEVREEASLSTMKRFLFGVPLSSRPPASCLMPQCRTWSTTILAFEDRLALPARPKSDDVLGFQLSSGRAAARGRSSFAPEVRAEASVSTCDGERCERNAEARPLFCSGVEDMCQLIYNIIYIYIFEKC